MAILTGGDAGDWFNHATYVTHLETTGEADTIYGMGGNDFIGPWFGNDVVYGGDGDDDIDERVFGEYHQQSPMSGNDTLNGDAGNDRLYGGYGDDLLLGGEGDDHLAGDPPLDALTGKPVSGEGSDNDRLFGGPGRDQLIGGYGTDVAYGGEDNDGIYCPEGYGEGGDDTLSGWAVADRLSGGDGNDTIVGQQGDDTLDGGDGSDDIWAGTGADVITGGGGEDSIYTYGNAINSHQPAQDTSVDTVHGGDERDQIHGSLGDQLHGDAGNDGLALNVIFSVDLPATLLDGGEGNDDATVTIESDQAVDISLETGAATFNGLVLRSIEGVILRSGRGNDHVVGGPLSDGISGNLGADTIDGGPGDDIIVGDVDPGSADGGNDILRGGAGTDTFFGAGGDDTIDGGTEDDVLDGGEGNDILDGGAGKDTMRGGNGNDIYRISSPADRINESKGAGEDTVILDFNNDPAAWRGADPSKITYELPVADADIEIIDVAPLSVETTEQWDGVSEIHLIGSLDSQIFMGSLHLTKGFAGADYLIQVDGDEGIDTVVLRDKRTDYEIRSIDAETVKLESLIDKRSALFKNLEIIMDNYNSNAKSVIERMQSNDGMFDLASANLNKQSNVSGSAFDDVLVQNSGDGQVYFAKMAEGAFESWGAVTGTLGSDWKAVASGDVDPATWGGAETFVQQQSTGTIYYASLDTGATTWGVVSNTLTADWKLRAVMDVTGDASVDAIVQEQSTGTIYFADMRGGQFQSWGVVNSLLTADWVVVGAGDLNRDGFADVVVQNQSTGTTYYANMAGGQFAGWGVVSTTLTADWRVKAVADVTGDGFADVIFQNTPGGGGINPGTTYFADVSTGTVQWGAVTTTVTADWVVQGAADVDNDGLAEVLFQNSVGGGGINPGTTYYASMGPDGFEGWGAVATNISAEWQVV